MVKEFILVCSCGCKCIVSSCIRDGVLEVETDFRNCLCTKPAEHVAIAPDKMKEKLQ